MKKLFLIGTFLCSIFAIQGYSQCGAGGCGQNYAPPVSGYAGGDCCAPCDQPCNNCYCMYVHYEPCYSSVQRCYDEQVPCQKTCCRYVPRYYQVQRCRYVPEYYCDTVCRQEPEYYNVDYCVTRKRYYCEPQCRYVPRYYWKHVCGDQCSNVQGY